MIVLKFNKKVLIFCGILSKSENLTLIEKALKVFINFLFVFGNVYCCGVSSAMYIYHNPDNISGVVNAVIFFFCGVSMFGSYLGFISNETNIKILHRKLQNLVNDGK